ncbi:uncharacterized protein LOC131064100 [Cryptomeria japonica]|uniref:uncharacterized protein LOC131064100 n=1 Tax=Cryptomeria japonica TaxID=3369 RepID=UPI0027DA43E2|nr:uncharacterized protein LOC131064100 [Cryptomeria japonica]
MVYGFLAKEDRQTCLHSAAYAGHLDVVQLILGESRFCLNIIPLMLLIGDEKDVTPLHAAVHGGHQEIVSEILKPELNDWHKSVMKKKDKFGGCAIHERP